MALVDALVVDPRRPHRDRAGRGGHLPLGVVAVANHQPVPVHVDLAGMGRDGGGHLGSQRRRQHLPRSVTHDRIQQRRAHRRTARCVAASPVVDYLEHGRTFPNRRA